MKENLSTAETTEFTSSEALNMYFDAGFIILEDNLHAGGTAIVRTGICRIKHSSNSSETDEEVRYFQIEINPEAGIYRLSIKRSSEDIQLS